MSKGMWIFVCCALIFSGVSPEIQGMSVPSGTESIPDSGVVQSVSPGSGRESVPLAGGYYSSAPSSPFQGTEDFLAELVEFYLFLVMLGYVIGYTDWIPWEQNSK